MIEVAVQPEPELTVARADTETFVVAFYKIEIFPGPVEHLKLGAETEQETLAGSVEMIGHLQGARS